MTDIPNIEAIGQALAMVPSGCCIVTCKAGDASTGMLASWVQQAAFDPPMISMAIKRGRHIASLIDTTGRFTLNVIGEDPTPMFKHFGKGFGPGETAFDGLDVATTDYGVELAATIAHLSCEVRSSHQAGDHQLYLATVVDGRGGRDVRPYVHVRKSGLSY